MAAAPVGNRRSQRYRADMSLEENWAECDHCGTCVREWTRFGRAEVLCKDCLAAAENELTEAHAFADEAVSTADVALLREGK